MASLDYFTFSPACHFRWPLRDQLAGAPGQSPGCSWRWLATDFQASQFQRTRMASKLILLHQVQIIFWYCFNKKFLALVNFTRTIYINLQVKQTVKTLPINSGINPNFRSSVDTSFKEISLFSLIYSKPIDFLLVLCLIMSLYHQSPTNNK